MFPIQAEGSPVEAVEGVAAVGGTGATVRRQIGGDRQHDYAWREVYNAAADTLTKIDADGVPPQAFLGVAGMPGMTAYVGLLRIAELKAGDVVFVSAASGAVGSAVVQIAKLKGATVIGSAGGAEKCAFLKEIGCDEVIEVQRS